MKLRIAIPAILCLALTVLPARAGDNNGCSLPQGCLGPGYDNGPINGTTDAWTINFGYVVSDTFTVATNGTVASVSFGAWEFPGDTMLTVDWTITARENGTGVGQTSNVTDKYISTNQYGYNIDLVSFNTSVPLAAGTYWLNLYNATVPSGDPVYWDENSGAGCGGTGGGANCPATASESAVGTIPSEAFTINSPEPPPVPEPGSILLFGSGIVALAGVLRWQAAFLTHETPVVSMEGLMKLHIAWLAILCLALSATPAVGDL